MIMITIMIMIMIMVMVMEMITITMILERVGERHGEISHKAYALEART